MGDAWQQTTPTYYVTVVSYSVMMRVSLSRETSEKFLSALQSACVIGCCVLLTNGRQSTAGLAEITLRTELPRDMVSALIAKAKLNNPAFTATVSCAPHLIRMNTNVVIPTH